MYFELLGTDLIQVRCVSGLDRKADKFRFLCERKTKVKINIIPLEKIEIDGKSIKLGMKKE